MITNVNVHVKERLFSACEKSLIVSPENGLLYKEVVQHGNKNASSFAFTLNWEKLCPITDESSLCVHSALGALLRLPTATKMGVSIVMLDFVI